MSADQVGGSPGPSDPPAPSRRLDRLLRGFATRVESVRTAEFNYHGVMLTESLRAGSKAARTSGRRVDVALAGLKETVVDLQDGHSAVLSQAEVEGMSPEAVCAVNETFAAAERQYAGYLEAHTYDQVHELARKGPFRGRSD